MWLILIGVVIGAVAVTIFYVWFGYRDVQKTVPGVDLRDDVQYLEALETRFGPRDERKPFSITVTDSNGTHVRIEWDAKTKVERITSNLKEWQKKSPFPSTEFKALRKWLGEIYAVERTGHEEHLEEQHGDG